MSLPRILPIFVAWQLLGLLEERGPGDGFVVNPNGYLDMASILKALSSLYERFQPFQSNELPILSRMPESLRNSSIPVLSIEEASHNIFT